MPMISPATVLVLLRLGLLAESGVGASRGELATRGLMADLSGEKGRRPALVGSADTGLNPMFRRISSLGVTLFVLWTLVWRGRLRRGTALRMVPSGIAGSEVFRILHLLTRGAGEAILDPMEVGMEAGTRRDSKPTLSEPRASTVGVGDAAPFREKMERLRRAPAGFGVGRSKFAMAAAESTCEAMVDVVCGVGSGRVLRGRQYTVQLGCRADGARSNGNQSSVTGQDCGKRERVATGQRADIWISGRLAMVVVAAVQHVYSGSRGSWKQAKAAGRVQGVACRHHHI